MEKQFDIWVVYAAVEGTVVLLENISIYIYTKVSGGIGKLVTASYSFSPFCRECGAY